jgi:multidrug transporter EmrE-like cation transporter
MLVACITNGLGAFGLKVLAERKLTDRYEVQYLVIWYLGWLLLGVALASREVAGNVAFSIGTGGTLFVVALAGVLVFKEKVGPYGLAGLILGILSIAALSVT